MIQPHDIVYIAGPMTGFPLFNYPAFFGWAGLIAKEFSAEVVNPARQPNGLTYEEYLRRGIVDVNRSTVVVALRGHENSNGAKLELSHAAINGKRIIYQADLERWLEIKIGGTDEAL